MKRTVVTLIALAALVGTAHADDGEKKKRAKELWNDGANQYDLGSFDESIVLFKQAFETWPFPAIEYNLCQAYRQKKDYTQAIWQCKAYLRNDEDASNKDAVLKLIDDMEKLKKAQEDAANEPPKGVGRPGTVFMPIMTPPRERWYQDPVGWGFTAGGVVALAVSGGLLLSASGLENDASLAVDEMDRIGFREDAADRRTMAAVVGGVGAGLVVTGVVLLAVQPSHHAPRKNKKGAKVVIGPAWLGVAGTF